MHRLTLFNTPLTLTNAPIFYIIDPDQGLNGSFSIPPCIDQSCIDPFNTPIDPDQLILSIPPLILSIPPLTLTNAPIHPFNTPTDPSQAPLTLFSATSMPAMPALTLHNTPAGFFQCPPLTLFNTCIGFFLHPHSIENVHRPDSFFYLQTQLDTPPIRLDTPKTQLDTPQI